MREKKARSVVDTASENTKAHQTQSESVRFFSPVQEHDIGEALFFLLFIRPCSGSFSVL